MKKTKFLALALAAAIALMGAGYAAWTDQLNINTEVKTGHLDVHFVDTENEFDEVSSYVTTTVGYAQDEEQNGQNTWDIANVKIGNMYPDAKANVTLKINNNSTIPVKMNKLVSTWDATAGEFYQIGASMRYFDASGKALEVFTYQGNPTSYANPWSEEQLANAELPIGGYATITFMFRAGEDVKEDHTYTFTAMPTFKQFNK